MELCLPFPPTYLGEVRFSSYIAAETMSLDRLNTEAGRKIQLISIKPNIKEI